MKNNNKYNGNYYYDSLYNTLKKDNDTKKLQKARRSI